jgi:hypothetical protein
VNLPIDLVPGSAYSRSDLHDALGRQRQGGMSTPARYPVILPFSSHRGAELAMRMAGMLMTASTITAVRGRLVT